MVLLSVTLLAVLGGQKVKAQDDAKTTIQRAIDAHGGADRLNRYPAGLIKACGTICVGPTKLLFRSAFVYHMPDKVRDTVTITVPNPAPLPGIRRSVTCILNGDKAQAVIDGQVQTLSGPELERFRQAIHVQNLIRLTPILDAKIYTLSSVGTSVICDRPCKGVKIAAEGRRDAIMFFDRASYLLVKIERYGTDFAGQDVPQEEFYSHYLEVRGIMHPTKTVVTQRGKKYIESETMEFLPLVTVDPIEFIAP